MIPILLTGLSLSMDAFAASIAMSVQSKKTIRLIVLCGLFGFFQGLMPLLGYWLGEAFEAFITPFDHWIAFTLLSFLGLRMLIKNESDEVPLKNLSWKLMLTLAVATSIDAFVVGISLPLLTENIFLGVVEIGLITFVLSLFGIFVGRRFGDSCSDYATKFGGLILIFLGVKILISHLFF